jgi:hypothetical protein
MPAQPVAVLFTLSGYPALDATLPQNLAALLGIVGLVGVKLSRTLARASPTWTLDRLYSVHQFLGYIAQRYYFLSTSPVPHRTGAMLSFQEDLLSAVR